MHKRVQPGEQLVLALYVRSMEQSSSFYKRLGFQVIRDEGTFMELGWEDNRLFLVEMKDAVPPKHAIGNMRIMVPNVDEHWDRANELGLEVQQPLADRYYGLRDFMIAGPDGLNIRLATNISNARETTSED